MVSDGPPGFSDADKSRCGRVMKHEVNSGTRSVNRSKLKNKTALENLIWKTPRIECMR